MADRDPPSADSQDRGRPPAAEPAGEEDDPVDLLQRLAELREQGVLTEDEFAAEKRDILQS